uniref:UDP-N-acetylglucosamine diphosphorylase n=1 Tax=Entamoeba invadens TaxID=33085 RepID=S0B211_ENTIV|nr:UDP-N-acetylglucosamine pyrophosphorylase, putative [Entamoeba invadens]
MSDEQLESKIATSGQSHLLKFVSKLSPNEKSLYYTTLASLDFDCISKLLHPQNFLTGNIAPFPNVSSVTSPDYNKWINRGLKLIKEGRAAVVMLAGGQGTRLGFDHPKGCYDISLPSHKSLFQIQSERLQSLQRLANTTNAIPLVVMTNHSNSIEIQQYYESHNYFGLNKNDVYFFEQGMLPAVDKDGKVLMETTHSVSLSPNGNGGVYRGLMESGVLANLDARGVKYVIQTAVDNVLNKMADPAFIGYMDYNGFDCCAKVLPKTSPKEAVGVLVLKNNEPAVVEYSEISGEMAERRDSKGELVFNAAHICNNGYTVEFLKKVGGEYLPFHIAHKKVPFIDADGKLVHPESPNGFKFEMFIFDAFRLAKKMGALEVRREEEFSPLKNANDAKVDCPDSGRKMFCEQAKNWLRKAGARVDDSQSDLCEISFAKSYNGEGLEEFKDKTIKLPFCVN